MKTLTIQNPKDYKEFYDMFVKHKNELWKTIEFDIEIDCTETEAQLMDKFHWCDDCPEYQDNFIAAKMDSDSIKKLFSGFHKKSFDKEFEPNYFYMFPKRVDLTK